MKKELIQINGLSFKYDEDGDEVLSNVDLTIHEGEWVSIVGHNGSGKSTLAKFLNALLIPYESNVVLVEGLDTVNEENIWEVRKKVGMVFQNPDNQMVATTVRDDVAFGLENIGIPPKEMVARIEWALKRVNMEKYTEYEPHRLSGGQKQRIAIAGILAMRPSIIILDEATSMLDPIGRQEVLETVRMLKKEDGITVINITHDLEEVVNSDIVFVMNRGNIKIHGTPQYVFQQTEEIIGAGLELPFSLEVQKQLKSKGYQLSNACLTKEDLVNELWKLRLKT